MPLSLTGNESQLLEELENGEQGLADYGVRMIGGTMIFHLGQQYKWNTSLKLWRPLSSKGQAQQNYVKQFLDDSTVLASKLEDELRGVCLLIKQSQKKNPDLEDQKERLENSLNLLKKAKKTIFVITKQNGIWKKIESLLASVQGLNNYNDVLPLKGGKKICLRTGEISDRTSEDLWSYEIQANGLEATEEEHRVSRWFYSNYARDDAGLVDESMLDFLQEVCAYATSFETSGKCFFVIKGPSNTGKSYFFERLAGLLKERVGGCSPEVFTDTGREEGHKTYYQDLEGKSAVCISELKENAPINGPQMKRLTGDGDIIKYRVCYGTDMRSLEMKAVIFILTNFTQSFNGGDSGMITRFVQIPFRFIHHKGHRGEYQERLKTLNSQGGYNATLAWVVEGTKRMFAKLQNGEEILVQPKVVKDASKLTVQENDHFNHFITENCDVWTVETKEKRDTYNFARRPLQTAYTQFMNRHPEYKGKKLNPSDFVARVRSEYSNGKADGNWVGIRPRQEPYSEDE